MEVILRCNVIPICCNLRNCLFFIENISSVPLVAFLYLEKENTCS